MKLKSEDLTKLLGLSVGYIAFAGLYSLFFNYLQNQLGITFRPAYFFFITFYFQLPLIAMAFSYMGYKFHDSLKNKKELTEPDVPMNDTEKKQFHKTRTQLTNFVLLCWAVCMVFFAFSFYQFYFPKENHFTTGIGLAHRNMGYALLALLFAAQLFVFWKAKPQLKKKGSWLFYFAIEVGGLLFLYNFQNYQYKGVRWDKTEENAIARANSTEGFSLDRIEKIYAQQDSFKNKAWIENITQKNLGDIDAQIAQAVSETRKQYLNDERAGILDNLPKVFDDIKKKNFNDLQVNLQRVYKDSIMKGSINLAVLMFCLVLFLLLYNYLFGTRRNEKSDNDIDKKINLQFNIIEFAIFGVFLLSVSIYRVPPKDDINTKSPFASLNPVSNIKNEVSGSYNTTDSHDTQTTDQSSVNNYNLSFNDSAVYLKSSIHYPDTTINIVEKYNDLLLSAQVNKLTKQIADLNRLAKKDSTFNTKMAELTRALDYILNHNDLQHGKDKAQTINY